MEIRQLKVFVAVCDTGGFTAAAKRINYSQSAVSDAIASLERELTFQLFERLGRKIQLTEHGRQLLPLANRMIALEQDALAIGKSKKLLLRIGITESLSVYRLPAFLQTFALENNGLILQIETVRTEEIPELLRLNRIDIGLSIDDDPYSQDMQVHTLFQEEIVLIDQPCSTADLETTIAPMAISGRNAVISKGMTGYNKLFHDICQQHQIKIEKIMHIESIEGIKNFVANGFGIGFLPISTVRRDLQEGRLAIKRLEGQRFEHHAKIILHKDKYMTEELQRFHKSLIYFMS